MIGNAILPAWVEREDVDQERAIDALGLQGFADEIADYILPGLSVATWRARYISFFCWVRERITGPHSEYEHKIHQWEIALALTEQTLGDHSDARGVKCTYVGSRSVVKYMEEPRIARSHPEIVYKTPAWRSYRPMLIDLGLIRDCDGWSLTDAGSRLAGFYGRGKASGPFQLTAKACLSRMSAPERRSIRALIGLSNDIKSPGEDLRKRKEFISELRRRFRTVPPIGPWLEKYEVVHGSRNLQLVQHLHAASTWEWLCLGLNTLFVAWVKAIGRGNEEDSFKKAFCVALASRHKARQRLGEITMVNQAVLLKNALSALKHARRLNRLPNPLLVPVQGLFDTATDLLDGGSQNRRSRVNQFLETLGSRHKDAKGEDAWIMPKSDNRWRLSESRAQLPDTIRLHSYRMSAFGRIVHDLGGLHA